MHSLAIKPGSGEGLRPAMVTFVASTPAGVMIPMDTLSSSAAGLRPRLLDEEEQLSSRFKNLFVADTAPTHGTGTEPQGHPQVLEADEAEGLQKEDKTKMVQEAQTSPAAARVPLQRTKAHTKRSAAPSPALLATQPTASLFRPSGTLFIFRSDVVDPPATLVMGADKHENDNLVAQATGRVVFFHVHGLPSAHVYLQLEPRQELLDVPVSLLQDAAQLCKANSSQAKKMNKVTVIYTLGSNLRKTRNMAAGEVGFFSERDVKKIVVNKRDDKVLARLNNTKRKVLGERLEREKEQRARVHQSQKAKAKEQKMLRCKQKEEQADDSDEREDTEDQCDQMGGTLHKQAPQRRRGRRETHGAKPKDKGRNKKRKY